jgi:flagellar basal-body rod modification protein FlgD
MAGNSVVSSTTSSANATATSLAGNKANQAAQSKLGKDDFLQLLVTQLRFQDPLNPMEDKEFIAQMAQFNSLEEMQKLNKTMAAQNDFNQLASASSMIGKRVAVDDGKTKFMGRLVEIRRVDGNLKALVQETTVDDQPVDKKPATVDFSSIMQVAA